MPPSTITSASATLAAHTPPTVPPARICMCARMGLLRFLTWVRILQTVSRYVSAMRRKLCSTASRSMSKQGVSRSLSGVPGAGRYCSMKALLSALFLAILPTRGHAPHGFQAAIAYSVYVVIQVHTGANVIGCQPEGVTEAQTVIGSALQPQTAMLSAQRGNRGTRQVGRYRQPQVNTHRLLASV